MAFFQLDKYSDEEFKKPLQVYFHNEEGLDAGGIRKEFFLLLTKEILNPQYGMFSKLNSIRKQPAYLYSHSQRSTRRAIPFGSATT